MVGAQASRPELGSFSQPETVVVSGAKSCRRCGSERLTRIRMRTPTGIDAVFVSCLSCEQTGWFAVDGDQAPLDAAQVGDHEP